MSGKRARHGSALAASLAVLACAVAGCGGSSPATDAAATASTATVETPTDAIPSQTSTSAAQARATVVRIDVKGGRAVGGIERVAVAQGDSVRLGVASDAADEVHVHGYDLTTTVAPGTVGWVTIDATIPGRFEIELERAGVQIGELAVSP